MIDYHYTIDIKDFQVGDIVGIQFYNNEIEYGEFKDINIDARSVILLLSSNKSLFEAHEDKWNMLFPYSIESKVLLSIGFKPESDKIAYGCTQDKWIFREHAQTWTLYHEEDKSTWTLELNENNSSQTILKKQNLCYIHQVQQIIRNYKIIIFMEKDIRICVIGLGYVGLPLARLFSTKYPTVGFDMNVKRCEALMAGHDATLEVSDELLQDAINNHGFRCTANIDDIRDCNFYVVAVPTPVDENNNPDLRPLWGASETVGNVISNGDIVVYESTVYPGVTEDECIPVVERVSGLKFNKDFYAGYSPERINPGDKLHTVEKIKKVTSGSTPEIGKVVNEVYSSVITAGTHLAPSIKVAEAAKVIENSQRDINIAFVNELSKIFTLMGIDTMDVLEAASTKWNFLPFKPGLVGGHCIGVDPYYLAQCAQRYGYNPEIILAGRRMNDGMGAYVADRVIKLMLKKGIQVLGSHIIIFGFTFKENCPDVRNTKVVDIVKALKEYNLNITIFDPWANPEAVRREYGLEVVNELPTDEKFDAAIVAVAHREFDGMDFRSVIEPLHIIFDVKATHSRELIDGRL